MRAFRNLSGAEIFFCGDVGAPLASCGDIETEALPIGLDPKKVESLTSRTKIIRLFGRIELGIKRMKEPIEKVPLVLFRNSNAEILNLELYPLAFLFQNNPYHSFIRRILYGVLQEAHQRLFEDLGIDEQMEILFPVQLKLNVPMAGSPF